MRDWLVQIRNEAKMSQQAVADQAGISQAYYAGIELGVRGKPLGVPIAKKLQMYSGSIGPDSMRIMSSPARDKEVEPW